MKVTGHLRVKNGIWQMAVRVPASDGTVKQKSKSTGIQAYSDSKREVRINRLKAEQMLASYILELSKYGSYGANKLFLFCIEDWLIRKKEQIRTDTYESYLCNYNAHIKPYFEKLNLKLEEITPRIIQRYVFDKQKEGQSSSSIRKHLVIFNGVFREALIFGEVLANPCSSIVIKSSADKPYEGSSYDIDLAKELLKSVAGDPIETAVYLGLYLGLRRSEVAGLRWKDLDLTKGIAHICNTVVRFSTLSEVERTKSRASKRDLFLPSGLTAYLKARLMARKEECVLIGIQFTYEEHVCSWPDGSQYKPDYISRRFAMVLERAGLPKIRFHDLRHTAGSLLINNGNTVKQVQEFLGHEKASTTLDIYSHISVERKKDTAKLMDVLLDV